MKKFLLVLLLQIILSVNAADFEKIDYKNLKNGAKISASDNGWTKKVNKKTKHYYIKKVAEGINPFSEFYSKEGNFLFSTATEYDFIYKGRLIGYSNSTLKFYEFDIEDNILMERELTLEEVQELFPKYEIVTISQFSMATNSLKIKKKKRKDLKLILLNDTDLFFHHYGFSTNNSEYKTYKLNGFLNITKKGLIQFSKYGDNSKYYPWFVLLVR